MIEQSPSSSQKFKSLLREDLQFNSELGYYGFLRRNNGSKHEREEVWNSLREQRNELKHAENPEELVARKNEEFERTELGPFPLYDEEEEIILKDFFPQADSHT